MTILRRDLHPGEVGEAVRMDGARFLTWHIRRLPIGG